MTLVEVLNQLNAPYMAKEMERRRIKRYHQQVLHESIRLRSHPLFTSNHDFKLRSSRWFDHDDVSIVCSIFENGFIMERKLMLGYEGTNAFGLVLWDLGYEKSKDPDHLKIYTVQDEKVVELKLMEFWAPNTRIKISNGGDRHHPVNDDESIRLQLERALKKTFDGDDRFVYFCRYSKPKTLSETGWAIQKISKIFSRIRALSSRW